MTSTTEKKTLPTKQLLQPSCSRQKLNTTPKKEANLVKFQEQDLNSTLPKFSYEKVKKEFEQRDQAQVYRKKVKKLWTKEEDQRLIKLVQSRGAKQWATISTHFDERCGKQCRERWHNHLRSGIIKGQWKLQEEWRLYLGVCVFGKKWSIISKMLPGRTQNTLKNHWNCKMKPKKSPFESRLKALLVKKDFKNDLPENEVVLIQNLRSKKQYSEFELKDRSSQMQKLLYRMKTGLQQFLLKRDEALLNHYSTNKNYDWKIPSMPGDKNWLGTECCPKQAQTTRQRSHDKIEKDNKNQYICQEFQIGLNQENQSSELVHQIKKSKKLTYEIKYEEEQNSVKYQEESSYSQLESQLQQSKDENEDESEDESEAESQNSKRRRQLREYDQSMNEFESPMKNIGFNSIYLGSSNKKK